MSKKLFGLSATAASLVLIFGGSLGAQALPVPTATPSLSASADPSVVCDPQGFTDSVIEIYDISAKQRVNLFFDVNPLCASWWSKAPYYLDHGVKSKMTDARFAEVSLAASAWKTVGMRFDRVSQKFEAIVPDASSLKTQSEQMALQNDLQDIRAGWSQWISLPGDADYGLDTAFTCNVLKRDFTGDLLPSDATCKEFARSWTPTAGYAWLFSNSNLVSSASPVPSSSPVATAVPTPSHAPAVKTSVKKSLKAKAKTKKIVKAKPKH